MTIDLSDLDILLAEWEDYDGDVSYFLYKWAEKLNALVTNPERNTPCQ